jgi:hypothetical protein
MKAMRVAAGVWPLASDNRFQRCLEQIRRDVRASRIYDTGGEGLPVSQERAGVRQGHRRDQPTRGAELVDRFCEAIERW